MTTSLKRNVVLTGVLLGFFLVSSAMGGDYMEMMRRKTPANGPVNTPVESWTILAPGTGGLGAPTCALCTDQMPLYDDIIHADTPFTQRTLSEYYKEGQVGLYSASTYQKKPRSLFPDADWDNLVEALIRRGYTNPINYQPPDTLHARIDWDEFHVPHVVGETVEDVVFGLGYATVYTNMFELFLFRFAGLSGILQTGGIDIYNVDFSDLKALSEQVMNFQPLNYTQEELMDTFDHKLCDELLGPDCQEMASALVAYQEGINQAIKTRHPIFKVLEGLGIPWPRWESFDVAAPGLAITGIFGDPGADQLANLATYRRIQTVFGPDRAKAIFDDYQLKNAPLDETTVTTRDSFANPVYADGSDDTDPDRFVDPEAIAWVDLGQINQDATKIALLSVDKPHASNWMVIAKEKSASGHPLLVGGPQMGYIQPNVFMEFDARTADNRFQITGVSLPGLFIATIAGSGHNGVWSPTSAVGKTSDLFVEKLCSPDGAQPVDPKSKYYRHQGECKSMKIRADKATPFTVHGPVIAWDSVDGQPVAISRQSYNSARISQGIMPYYALAKGSVKTAAQFIDIMQHHTLALNYAYINESEVAYINTGLYPIRAAGAQTDLPTWGTGQWDWQGVIPLVRRPHMLNPPEGFMLSWNNQSAPGFYQSDGDFQRVQILRRLVRSKTNFDLASLAEASQTAAVQDGLAVTFLPLLSVFTDNLSATQTEEDLSPMLAELTTWAEDKHAKRIDLDGDDLYDDAGPAIMDEIMICLKEELETQLNLYLGALNMPSESGSAYLDGTTSVIRMLLNRARQTGNDPSQVDEDLLQCGDGTYAGCRALVLKALTQAKVNLTNTFGTDTPALWRKVADTIAFMPLDSNRATPWHWQNRPTFQQVATVH